MFARNIGIWKIQGINALLDGPTTKPLAGGVGDDFWAELTNAPEQHLVQVEQLEEIANIFLDVTFGGRRLTSFSDELSQRMQTRKAHRTATDSGGVYLVCNGKAKIQQPKFKVFKEFEGFSFAMGGLDKKAISKSFKQQSEACLIGLALSPTEKLSFRVMKVGDAFFLEDGRDGQIAYISGDVSLSMNAYVSRKMDDEGLRRAVGLIERVRNCAGMSHISSMLLRSMHKGTNEMDRFVLAWACLEMLINKAFESETHGTIASDLAALQLSEKNKTKLGKLLRNGKQLCHWPREQKMAIVAARLSPGAAEEDTANFAAYYGIRNDLYHEASFPERLPLEGVTDLAKKYLRLVIECEPSETPVPRP